MKILKALGIAAVLYLVLAFIEWSWCFRYWTGLSRFVIAFVVLIEIFVLWTSKEPKKPLGEE